MTAPDNLTDEQRDALGRGLQDLLLGRSPFEAGWFESAASALYLAGRDDERAKWKVLDDACREYMIAMATCDDADVYGEESVCMDPECAYCNLCRAAQPGMYPDATGGEPDGK